MHYCLLLTLLGASLLPPAAQAQTARIAHLSHSGSAATLDAAAENFGIIGPYFVVDSVRLLTDTTALEYGKWVGHRAQTKVSEKTKTIQFTPRRADGKYGPVRTEYLQGLQRSQHPVKLVGDTVLDTSKATTPEPAKAKRKKSAFLLIAPTPPQHPGVALAVAAILVLTGAGWLLGERKPRPQPAA